MRSLHTTLLLLLLLIPATLLAEGQGSEIVPPLRNSNAKNNNKNKNKNNKKKKNNNDKKKKKSNKKGSNNNNKNSGDGIGKHQYGPAAYCYLMAGDNPDVTADNPQPFYDSLRQALFPLSKSSVSLPQKAKNNCKKGIRAAQVKSSSANSNFQNVRTIARYTGTVSVKYQEALDEYLISEVPFLNQILNNWLVLTEPSSNNKEKAKKIQNNIKDHSGSVMWCFASAKSRKNQPSSSNADNMISNVKQDWKSFLSSASTPVLTNANVNPDSLNNNILQTFYGYTEWNSGVANACEEGARAWITFRDGNMGALRFPIGQASYYKLRNFAQAQAAVSAANGALLVGGFGLRGSSSGGASNRGDRTAIMGQVKSATADVSSLAAYGKYLVNPSYNSYI